MGKNTIRLNLDDTGIDDDTLISSILNTTQNLELKGKTNQKKEKKTITVDLGEDYEPEIKLSDIKIEKPMKKPPKQKSKKVIDSFTNEIGISKIEKVAKLDDFFKISKDENANSLNHPKTKDYQVGKWDAEIKLQNIQTQIGKLNIKISKKGRNNVDTKYLDSLTKLLRKEKKYLSIINSFSKNNNCTPLVTTPDVNNISINPINDIQNNKTQKHYSIKKIRNTPPKTNNIVTEIDDEMARINSLLDLTEGKNGKYSGLKGDSIENYNNLGHQMKNINNSNSTKEELKNVNLQMNLNGVDYLSNMDINKLKKCTNKVVKKDGKDDVSLPKTMFGVKANLLVLKEREKLLAKQKRKIQVKLEFKKKQILKAHQQEKAMRKFKALEEEKRRLFELDRDVKRLDKLSYQQSLEMKNTMKYITQKGILTQQNIDNIQKEEFLNKQHQKIISGKNGYPIYQPYTYNSKTHDRIYNNNNYKDKRKSNSPTLLTKLHNNMLHLGIGEQVIFNSSPFKENKIENNQSQIINNTSKLLNVSNKGYKYIRKDFVDSQNIWQDWKISHLEYFKNNDTNIFLYPYNRYLDYLNDCIICKNIDFSNKIIISNNKNSSNISTNNIGNNNLLNIYKREIYKKIPLEDRKTELCQYLGIKKRENLEQILDKGMVNILPINKDNSKVILLKIWYGCFEEGKIFISNGTNKIFSQKSEKVETLSLY